MAFRILGYNIERRAKVVLGNPNTTLAQFIESLGFGTSYTGITVTDKSALTLSAVYACVKVLAETIAELPVDKFTRTATGKERVTDDIDHLVSTSPSPLYTSYQFRLAMQACVSLYGNAYATIDTAKNGKPSKLTIVDPGKVEIKRVEESGEIIYVIDGKGVLEPWQMLHIKGMSFDGIVGLSPLAYHMEAISNGLALQEYGNRFFGQGSLASGVITRPGAISKEAMQALRTEWETTYKGRDNQHKIMILDAGMKFDQISIAPEQAQFIASRNYNVQDIARVYRLPLHMVGDLSRSTNNNIEQQSLEFVQYTMLPWIKNWEQELDRKLIKGNKEYFKFNVNALARGDMAARSAYYVQAIQNGWMSPNEVRELENMNRREGGDIYLTPMNLTTNPTNDGKENI